MSESLLITEQQLIEELSEGASADVIQKVLREVPTGEDEVRSWLKWCESCDNAKVNKFPVPEGILPKGLRGHLVDVKVGGKKRVPDDKIYNSDPEIRDKIARGNTVLELEEEGSPSTSDMVVFALRKFTGGMGDEDENQPEDETVWRKYFLKPLQDVKRIVVMDKENGEAAHFSARFIGGHFYLIGGSKNVHLIFRNRWDINKYVDSRFLVAKTVCEAVLDLVEGLTEHKRNQLLSFLHWSKLTAMMEILQPSYQHVVDLSFLTSPSLRFLCWTPQYKAEQTNKSLTSLPPDASLDLGSWFGFHATSYQSIPVTQFEEKELEVRKAKGYEGAVLYFMDEDDNVVGLLKKKTCWYVLLRAIREKISYAMSDYTKNPGAFKHADVAKHSQKITKRLGEIQKWLSLTDAEVNHWRALAISFLNWMVDKIKSARSEDGRSEWASRGRFPIHWKLFIQETGKSEDMGGGDRGSHAAMDVDGGDGVREREESEPVRLLEPGPNSPTIRCTTAGTKTIACIVRNLDLVGRNLGKLEAIIKKIHGKVCKERTLGYVGLHSLEKVTGSLELSSRCLSELHLIERKSIEQISGAELLAKNIGESSKTFVSFASSLEAYETMTLNDQVVCISPLGCSALTDLSEDTLHVLVVVHTSHPTLGITILDAVLKQIYHAKIGSSLDADKSLLVEKVRIVRQDGSIETFPTNLNVL